MPSPYNINEVSFHLLAEHVRDYAIFTLDSEGIIQSWNKGAELIKGYRAEEVIGKFISIFYTEEDVRSGKPQEGLKLATELGRYEIEGYRVRKDGSVFWADVVITVIKDNEGIVRGFLKITRDMTEARRRAEDLKANNQFLDTILENIPNMVFVKDAKDLRFIRFNKAGELLLGYSRNDLIGKNDYDFFSKEQADFFIDKDREVLAKGNVHDIAEEPIDTAHGKRWLHTKKIPILNGAGQPIYLLGISEDITDRKRVEEYVRHLNSELELKIAELEQSNAELESFSYSVSHDLRTPLRAIHGYTSILSENYGNSMSEEGRQMLQAVNSNARRMGQLIDDLLAFSRVGKKELQKVQVDMDELVEATVKEIRNSTDHFKHEIIIKNLHPAFGDKNLIMQVVINLLSNAVKYSIPKDHPKIEIGSYQQGNEVVYYVYDNGVGFDMRYYNKLFGVFQRLHAMEEFEGTGVGLALVKRIVERHNGRVWAESKLGEGAQFYFTLGTA